MRSFELNALDYNQPNQRHYKRKIALPDFLIVHWLITPAEKSVLIEKPYRARKHSIRKTIQSRGIASRDVLISKAEKKSLWIFVVGTCTGRLL